MREYLKNMRVKKKATQEDVAFALNMSQNNYSQIENGIKQKDMNLSLLIKLSNYFEVDLDYLIEQEKALVSMEGNKEWKSE